MTACGGKEAQVQTEESQTQGTTEATTQAEESKEALYTPGTYTGEAVGYGGNVSVTITVDASSITDVTVEGADETPTIGGAALEELAGQLKEAQDSEIDGVTGATITSTAVKTAAKSALASGYFLRF